MAKELVVSVSPLETKLAILEDDQLVEFYIERVKNRGILGNIYKGHVTKVLPGMQSAFVSIGLEKDAFLYVSDFFEETEEYERLFTTADERSTSISAAVTEDEPVRRSMRRDRDRDRRRYEERGQRPVYADKMPVSAPLEAARPAAVESVAETLEKWQLQHSHQDGEPAAPLPNENETAGQPGVSLSASREQAAINSPDHRSYFVSPQRRGRPAHRPRRNNSRYRPRENYEKQRPPEKQSIEDLLREGQEIIVQIAKEPIGKKGARVTSHVALPGRYIVYMPTVDHIGVSRRISSEAERLRLKDIVLRNRNNSSGGFIVRTAADGQSEASFQADIRYLVQLWDDIKARFERLSAPALLHTEIDLVERILRDQLSSGFSAIRVDDEGGYERILDFVNRFQPSLVSRVKLYTKDRPIYEEYGITAEVEKALQPKIWLKSGGYIVVNQTEALVAIDVNTGKFVGKSDSLEDTITNTNVEAVKEIIRQIRLRDLGGIIVIDFIDMEEKRNRKRVMEALEQEIGKDRSPTKTLEFNEFGLIAITRKRVKQSLERILCQICPVCNGSGQARSVTTTCYAIYDEARRMVQNHTLEEDELTIRVHPEVARGLRESEAIVIQELRHLTGREVTVRADPLMPIGIFHFE
ncbi:MAG: Rne/Rng family ribonuclease [Acidobacteria bacterium]|nr:Rne/Rng family ribonuclease [Acidobacteriota bacterium]MBI3655350.1 Rne/Rng family ribonuclease [Acidobacteriota bacterium]